MYICTGKCRGRKRKQINESATMKLRKTGGVKDFSKKMCKGTNIFD